MAESLDKSQQVAASRESKSQVRKDDDRNNTSIKSRQNVHPRTTSPVRHVEFNLSPIFRHAKRVKESQEQEDDESRYLGSRSSPAGSSSLGGRTALEARIYERSAVLQFQYELFGFDDDEEEEEDSDEYPKDDHISWSSDNNKHHHHQQQHQIRLDSSIPHHPHMSELWQPGTSNRRRSLSGSTVDEFMDKAQKEKLIERTELFKRFLQDMNQVISFEYEQNVRMEVRVHNLSFFVPYDDHNNQQGNIHTVWNQTLLYHLLQFFRRLRAVSWREGPRLFPQPAYRPILSNVNLCLKPGKMYLVLGAPSSGKTTLLKAIAGLLPNPRVLAGKNKGQPRPKSPFIDGVVEYNGQTMENPREFFLRNAISFIDQLERHAPRLTVRETFEFAFQCMSGGTHRPPGYHQDTASNGTTYSFHSMDEKRILSQYTMEMLGLAHVADTFVGDSNVRGISGGQRRRVTVGEMLQSIPSVSIMCADEISNGLDSRSTFAIINFLSDLCRINQRTRVISLLQPSPETFSLFDEVIVLAEGYIIYVGPIDRVVQYFEGLGYPLPKRMDVADYLQTVSTPDGAELFKPPSGSPQKTHYTAQGFAQAFQSSHLGQEIIHTLQSPHPHPWLSAKSNLLLDEESNLQSREEHHQIPLQLKIQYRNSFWRSTWLVMKRHFTLWIRDRRFVIANFVKNLVMGLSVGMVFFQTNAPAQMFGALFQSMLFIMLGMPLYYLAQ
jgi:ABC-type multidrug transport system ATPase subunit